MFKRLLLGLLALVVLVVAGLGVFVARFDANNYKDQISAQVQARSGRVLVLDGPFTLALWPRIALKAGPLRLANAAGFGDEPLLSAEQIQVALATAPLLRRRVEMDTLVLHGLRLNLARNAAGVTNWAELLDPPTAKQATPPTHGDASPLAALVLGGIDIQDGHVTWQDDVSGQHVELNKITATTGVLTFGQPMALKMSAHAHAKQPALDADIELTATLNYDRDAQHYVIAPLLLASKLHGPQVPTGHATVQLGARIEVDIKTNTAKLSGLRLSGLGLDARADIEAANILSTPTYAGHLTLARFDLRRLLKILNLPLPNTADPQTLNAAAVNTDFAGSAAGIKLTALDVVLDNSQLQGDIEFASGHNPQLNFKLAVDAIDADRYRPAPTKAAKQAIVTPDVALAGAAQALPVDVLRTLQSKGRLGFGTLQIAGATMKNVEFAIDAEHGLIKLQPLAAQLYGGRYDGSVVLDARGTQSKLALTTRLAKIQLDTLLQDTLHTNALAGVASVDAALAASADDTRQMQQTLAGSGHFGITDGVFRGFDAPAIRRAVEQVIACRCIVTVPHGGQTQFRRLAGTVAINNGVVHNDDLRMEGDGFTITGRGMLVNLNDNSLKYDLQLAIPAAGAAGAKSAAKLAGYAIPIACRGAVNSPSCLPDFRHILATVATDAAKKKIEKALGKQLKGVLGGKPGEPLQNLLKF